MMPRSGRLAAEGSLKGPRVPLMALGKTHAREGNGELVGWMELGVAPAAVAQGRWHGRSVDLSGLGPGSHSGPRLKEGMTSPFAHALWGSHRPVSASCAVEYRYAPLCVQEVSAGIWGAACMPSKTSIQLSTVFFCL